MNVIFTAGAEALIDHEAHKLVVALAHDVADEAQGRAPVRTGTLRDSIHVEETAEGAQVVASAPYALYVELGTSRMAAEPYLQPSLFHERTG